MALNIQFTPKALVTILSVATTAVIGLTNRDRPQYLITPAAAVGRNLENRFNEKQIGLLEKLNRSDRAHLTTLRHLIAPRDWSLDELDYCPLPARYRLEPPVSKLVIVHLPSQLFAGY